MDTAYILNTFLLLFSGCLVMFMAGGFAMLESGMVQSKNTTGILTKNVSLFGIACLAYLFVGYNFMYGEISNGSHAGMADFFFQSVFVATAASIISGTVAERMKFIPFMIVVAILASVIYPIQGAWTWGGGWLSEMGFSDFAGSTIVHSVGGWCALAAVILLGARKGRYNNDGTSNFIPPANLPLATLGTFVLWFGWFGFNGGSQLAMSSADDVNAIAAIIANTNIAACAGVVAVMIISKLLYKQFDLSLILNGALAGLVSITAGPDYTSMELAAFIGAVGGVIVMLAVPFFDKIKIDDPVGALSVHLAAGIWGTLAVGIFKPEASFVTQLIGVAAIGAFVFAVRFAVWCVLKYTIGIRIADDQEEMGVDVAEFGTPAYNIPNQNVQLAVK